MLNSPSLIDPRVSRTAIGSFNLAQAASTYTLLTANGDVWIEDIQAYVKTAAGNLTSVTIQSNHATPKSIVASILLAAILIDLQLTIVSGKFVLPDTKLITGTIVGTGNAGLIYVIAKWAPITTGATLA